MTTAPARHSTEHGDPLRLPALARLDALLRRALREAGLTGAGEAAADGEAVGEVPGWGDICAGDDGWGWLRGAYGLTEFELDVVLLALAPEVDLRYERMFAYVQDDVGRRRPTVGLALDLLTDGPRERLAARGRFAVDAPLTAARVLELVPAGPHAVAPPLLAHVLVPDPQIVDVLLGQSGLDRRLAPHCRLWTPTADTAAVGAADPRLLAPARAAWGLRPLRLHLHGPRGSGRRRAAAALAAALDVPLLGVDLGRLSDGPDDREALGDLLALVLREALLHGALPCLEDVDSVAGRPELTERLAAHDGVVVLVGGRPWTPAPGRPLAVRSVPCARLDAASRRAAWEAALAAHGTRTGDGELNALAGRFRLGPDQIENAVVTALAATDDPADPADSSGPSGEVALHSALFAAARAQGAGVLDGLARRVEPRRGWSDLVLPDEPLSQLRQLGDRVVHRQRVLDEWCFERRTGGARGVTALFAGPPGTGKSLAAEVIAAELGLDLYAVDLSAVVSKYVGETEKNLERVFTAADDIDAVLFFDEADALFGKRSEVHDAHDRYANTEVAYLLQRMERHDGIALLATNLRGHLDEAFTRRLHFVVDFPLPEEPERRRIWRVSLPEEAPLDPAVDLDALAADHRLAGGAIRNAALHAAYLAAAEGARIGSAHLLAGVGREYRALGRLAPPTGSPHER
ncbi:ATP-binding protein [Streptomyces sp. NBC_01275]|uniref:AAA family ATPase n=1 Tax=Streptomyces sp. NBC_01275 TaxID=2903807 RepID=UPI0022526293|nr:ATP-binding protein [Streptomyces sp. NBC_01275]MCX4759760.1 ATP-binding protein [Streptomyces sp. NBC_01275]